MFKVILLLLTSFSLLYPLDFKHCVKKTQESLVETQYGVGLAFENGAVLLYSNRPIESSNIIKKDPFMGLYLLKNEHKKEPFEIWSEDDEAYEDELISISRSNQHRGYAQKEGALLESFAKFSSPTSKNSAIVGLCYGLFGLGVDTKGSYVEPRYIKRFLYEDKRHKDLGVRIYKNREIPVVEFVDPFVNFGLFKRGDVITSIDSVWVDSIRKYTDTIDSKRVGQKVIVTVNRDGRRLEFQATLKERVGGGLIEDNFLKRVGIAIDRDFNIRDTIKTNSELKWLKVGDIITHINGKETKGVDIMELLTNLDRPYLSFLVRRGEFDFFIKIDLK